MVARHWFIAGLIMMCLFAVGHFAGFLQAARAARMDSNMAELTRAMSEYRSELLGFSPSMLDFREYFSLNFSILLGLAAALGFVVLSASVERPSLLRVVSAVYGCGMMLLLASSAFFGIVQGIISSLLIAALFAIAAWRSANTL